MKKILALMMCLVLVFALAAAGSAEQEGYTESVVSLDAGDHQIPATVCLPTAEGKHPAVVMLHGTGSSRDEAGGGYKTAAPILAAKYGIATIRIDFMGNGDSTADYKGYTFASAVGDAVTAAKYMASLDGVNPDAIGVMGWSQGGTDALLSAGEHPEIFKSVVTWAGAPSLKLDGFFGDAQYEEAKKNGFFVMNFDWRDSLNVSLQWCEDVMNTDVLAVFSAFEGPVLAIAGKNDTTVDPAWSDKIVDANKDTRSHAAFIDGMDHTFNVFSEEDLHSLKEAIDKTGEFFASTLG